MKHLLLFLFLLGSLVSSAVATDSVQALFPGIPLTPGRDYVLAEDGSIAEWKIKRYPQPQPAQLAAARAAIAAKVAQITALRGALLAEFAQLSPGDRLAFEPIFLRLRSLLMAGRVAEARQLLATMTVADALEARRDALVALFPNE